MQNRERIPELRQKELDAIKRIHPKHILKDLKAEIVKEGMDYVLARAPYRTDENPSLNYFLNSKGHWIWKDMAEGDAGSHIDLYIKAKNLTYLEAVRYLREKKREWELTQEMTQEITQERQREKTRESQITGQAKERKKIDKVEEKPLSEEHRRIIREERGYENIPPNIKSIEVYAGGRKFSVYGMRDENGNYVVRIKGTQEKRNIKLSDKGMTITVFRGHNQDRIAVVEGIHDYMALYQKYGNRISYLILNSVNHADRAIEYLRNSRHKQILLALDNDIAGEKAKEKLINALRDREIWIAKYQGKDLDELYRRDKTLPMAIERYNQKELTNYPRR